MSNLSPLKVYVASSWRNAYQQEVVQALRLLGYRVYDFRGAGDGWGDTPGEVEIHWSSIDDQCEDTPGYVLRNVAIILNNPVFAEGFRRDMEALKQCDALIALSPSCLSASAEMDLAALYGKPILCLDPWDSDRDESFKLLRQFLAKCERSKND